MSLRIGPHGNPLALASGLSHRALKAVGLFYVVLSLVLAGLFALVVLPVVISPAVDQPSGVDYVVMVFEGLGGLFLAFSWVASRQRAAIYRDGFVPPGRRLREFAKRRGVFVPFDRVYHVLFFTDREKRNMLWTRVYSVDGRWFDFLVGEVGGEVMVALNRVARGTAVPGLSLSREYAVYPEKREFRHHDTVESWIRSGHAPPQQGFAG